MSGRLEEDSVLRMRIEVLDTAAEVVVTVEELVVVVKGVVVSGHSYSGHGHPFGHPSSHVFFFTKFKVIYSLVLKMFLIMCYCMSNFVF